MTGIDGYDWSVFGGNPVPGDPDTVRVIAGQFRDLADETRTQNRMVRSVGSDSAGVWQGEAASAFAPVVGKLPGELDKLISSYADAADALDGYWPRLRDAQGLAVRVLAKAQAAQQAIATAHSQVSAADDQVGSARSSFNQASKVAAAATEPATATQTAHLSSLQANYQTARQQLGTAQTALSTGQADLASAQAMKEQAVSQVAAAGATVATSLQAASAAGIHNPHHSWLSGAISDIEHVGHDIVHGAAKAFTGAVHLVESHAFDLSLAFGPIGLLLTSQGRHLVDDAIHEATPTLEVLSGALGAVSLVLSVAAFIPVVGEFAEVANEGVMLAKTADDGVLALSGDTEAEEALAMDGLMDVTGGESRLFSRGGEILETGEKAGEDLETLEKAKGAVTDGEKAVSDAEDAVGTAQRNEQAASAAADRLDGQVAFLDHFGVDSTGTLRAQQEAEDAASGYASDGKAAQDTLSHANSALDHANRTLSDAQEAAATSSEKAAARAATTPSGAVTGLDPARSLLQQFNQTEGSLGERMTAIAEGQHLSGVTDFSGYYSGYLSGAAGGAHAMTLALKGVDFGAEAVDLPGNLHRIGDGLAVSGHGG